MAKVSEDFIGELLIDDVAMLNVTVWKEGTASEVGQKRFEWVMTVLLNDEELATLSKASSDLAPGG